MHREPENLTTWSYAYDGEGQRLTPDVIVGDGEPATAPDGADSRVTYPSLADADAEGERYQYVPVAVDAGRGACVGTCRCGGRHATGPWLVGDPLGLGDGALSASRDAADTRRARTADAASGEGGVQGRDAAAAAADESAPLSATTPRPAF